MDSNKKKAGIAGLLISGIIAAKYVIYYTAWKQSRKKEGSNENLDHKTWSDKTE